MQGPPRFSWLFRQPLWLLAALVCLGCASPTRHKVDLPATDTPDVWQENFEPGAAGPPSDLGAWWLRFADPLLASLVERALDGNTDVRQASAALEQAIALRDVAAAGLSATLGYSASAQSNFNSDGNATNNLQAGFNVGWNPDLFGVQHRALDARNANLQAALAHWGSVQASVASGVALNYIVLRSNQAGLIGAIEVEQALVAAQQTSAQLPPLEQAIARTLHALAVQTGRPPAALSEGLTVPAPVPLAPANLQLMSPAATLLARPDVQAAQ